MSEERELYVRRAAARVREAEVDADRCRLALAEVDHGVRVLGWLLVIVSGLLGFVLLEAGPFVGVAVLGGVAWSVGLLLHLAGVRVLRSLGRAR